MNVHECSKPTYMQQNTYGETEIRNVFLFEDNLYCDSMPYDKINT